MNTVQKKSGVPLEEALTIAGGGLYTCYVGLTSGLIVFSSLLCLQGMAVVMPVAGCELQLSNAARGILSSMAFTGMLFSAQIFGFFADTFGRKSVMLCSQLGILIVIVLWSLAPDTSTLGVILFVNGLFLTGTLTPVNVYVSEFCSPDIRTKALMGITGVAAMGNIYLPGMAWIILPLDIQIPILGQLIFTSWRLYILLLSVPLLLAFLLLWNLPETPKFLLSQGKQEETLEILRTMYAINQKKSKDEFPITSISLDLEDQASSKGGEDGNKFFKYLKLMLKQIVSLFSKQYIVIILILCTLFFCQNGICNSLVLWFPEQTSRVRHHSHYHEVFNVTLCNVMSGGDAERAVSCDLNYDFLSAGLILGSVEVVACTAVGLFANRMNKKLFLAGISFLSTAICFLAIFVTSEYIIIASLGIMIVILYMASPVLVSITVEVFPTQLRSTAASIAMTFARLGSAVGSQIMGVLYENHCKTGYFGLISILVASGVLSIVIPKKKRSS